jgi:hypothetical protein
MLNINLLTLTCKPRLSGRGATSATSMHPAMLRPTPKTTRVAASPHSSVNVSSVYTDSTERTTTTTTTQLDASAPATADALIPEKELNRRQKISKANKGKVPWNKGAKMTDAMKQKISQRTYEAMQRPDVRERMKVANANRAPHSDEVRKRIREVLRKRADDARVVIREQTVLIVDGLASSSDPEERDIAARQDAHDVIGRLSWRVLHRDFEEMYDKWEHDVDGYRIAVKDRFRELNERQGRARRRKQTSRVASSMTSRPTSGASSESSSESSSEPSTEPPSVLSQAEEKIASVSKALTKLQEMKAAYADDPESLQLVEEKEKVTAELLERLEMSATALRSSQSSMLPWVSKGKVA